MKLDIYVNYAGNCREAFLFYEQHLGGRIVQMMTHGEMPDPSRVPAELRDAVLHAQAERVYTLLADGGEIFMKMERTFFASRFAMLRDRFGTSWMLLHEQ